MAHSDANASEFDHCRERRTELVVSRCDPSEVFEFVKEALDKRACPECWDEFVGKLEEYSVCTARPAQCR